MNKLLPWLHYPAVLRLIGRFVIRSRRIRAARSRRYATIRHTTGRRVDWPVALAWWQDALNRDPTNVPLRRGVELAQWMVEYHRRGGKQPTTKGALIDPARTDDPEFFRLLDKVMDVVMLEEAIKFSEEWEAQHPLR